MDDNANIANAAPAQPARVGGKAAAFIIRCGDVYYVTTGLLAYDRTSKQARGTDVDFIERELAPFFDSLPPGECDARRIPGLPTGYERHAVSGDKITPGQGDKITRMSGDKITRFNAQIVVKPDDCD